MEGIEKVIVFNPIMCKIYENEETPHYYAIKIEFTDSSLSQIKNEIHNQIQEVFNLEESDNLKLKNFISSINKNKSKIEFEQFIIGGRIEEDKLCIGIKIIVNINKLKRIS